MKSLRILPFIFCFTLFGCEDILDCIIARNPSLPDKDFGTAIVDQFYEITLSAEISNEPRDNDYDYFFNVRGLPPGMDFFVDYRRIYIEGIPIQTGLYRISVDLDVDGPFRGGFEDDGDTLCNYSTSKTYILRVE